MSTNEHIYLPDILACLPEIFYAHARDSKIYHILDQYSKSTVLNSNLTDPENGFIDFGTFGNINFPFTKMGNITSLDLFGLDELIIFAFYAVNRKKYKNVADIGANIGLHSIMMSRCGWHVQAYEPDPFHASLLRRNLELNNIKDEVTVIESAVSDQVGTLEFVRVLGNTTSSHLAGAKDNAYGELERFPVQVEAISNIFTHVDFIKMDVEGQEAKIICATSSKDWVKTDMMLEVGSSQNASLIFDHLGSMQINMFSQKRNWNIVKTLDDMPHHYTEGSLFVSSKTSMPWG